MKISGMKVEWRKSDNGDGELKKGIGCKCRCKCRQMQRQTESMHPLHTKVLGAAGFWGFGWWVVGCDCWVRWPSRFTTYLGTEYPL